MTTDSVVIRRWQDLSELVERKFKDRWIYRGVPNHEHNLTPRIGRPGTRKNSADGLCLPYSPQEEQRILSRFEREARAKFEWEPTTPLEWMILGQHHLLPTRLLDWSESLLVAAFFAVEHFHPDIDAAIYAVESPPELSDLSIDPFSNDLGDAPRLIRPPHINPRITAQQSVLTLHPKPDNPWTANGIHVWKIPSSFAFTLKGILNFCGIHAASLFPDSADRHTEHLYWEHKWGR